MLIHGCTVLRELDNMFQDGAHSNESFSTYPFAEKAAILTVATMSKSLHFAVPGAAAYPVKKPEPLLLILSFMTITYTICLCVIGSLSNCCPQNKSSYLVSTTIYRHQMTWFSLGIVVMVKRNHLPLLTLYECV